jgi:hypothetical protein
LLYHMSFFENEFAARLENGMCTAGLGWAMVGQ